MTTSRQQLRLHEQILLLALRDERGTTEPKAGLWKLAFGGAILAELALAGRLEIDPGRKALTHVRDRTPLGEAILDSSLLRIADASRPARAARWVGRLSGTNLRRQCAEDLCRRGVLQKTRSTVLFAFTRTRFPTVDPAPEQALVRSIRAAVESDDGAVDERLASLIGIASAAGTLRVIFDRKTLRARKRRIEHIASADRAADATRAAVAAVQAAVMAAIAAAAAASAAG